jgi:hypothetical protein
MIEEPNGIDKLKRLLTRQILQIRILLVFHQDKWEQDHQMRSL